MEHGHLGRRRQALLLAAYEMPRSNQAAAEGLLGRTLMHTAQTRRYLDGGACPCKALPVEQAVACLSKSTVSLSAAARWWRSGRLGLPAAACLQIIYTRVTGCMFAEVRMLVRWFSVFIVQGYLVIDQARSGCDQARLLASRLVDHVLVPDV